MPGLNRARQLRPAGHVTAEEQIVGARGPPTRLSHGGDRFVHHGERLPVDGRKLVVVRRRRNGRVERLRERHGAPQIRRVEPDPCGKELGEAIVRGIRVGVDLLHHELEFVEHRGVVVAPRPVCGVVLHLIELELVVAARVPVVRGLLHPLDRPLPRVAVVYGVDHARDDRRHADIHTGVHGGVGVGIDVEEVLAATREHGEERDRNRPSHRDFFHVKHGASPFSLIPMGQKLVRTPKVYPLVWGAGKCR